VQAGSYKAHIVTTDSRFVLFDELEDPADLMRRSEVLARIDEGMQGLSL
jgi:hypothetical protein